MFFRLYSHLMVFVNLVKHGWNSKLYLLIRKINVFLKDHFSELFGVTRQETARLSKQVQGININQHKETTQLSKRAQNVNTSPTTCHPAQPKAPSSISSLNSNSSSTELSSSIRTKKQNENCLVTNKLLSTTIHVTFSSAEILFFTLAKSYYI